MGTRDMAYEQRPEDGRGGRVVPLRLQKFLARAGVASRRASENLMTAGRVTVNGEVVRELGTKVDPLIDEVAVDGRVITWRDEPATIMLHKPAGVITTMVAQSKTTIVADLVPTDRYPGLYPIGRLDADTTGLLLFSTDGDLGNRLLHPSHHVPKTYIAHVQGSFTDSQLEQLRKGVQLDDGPTQPAEVELVLRARSGAHENAPTSSKRFAKLADERSARSEAKRSATLVGKRFDKTGAKLAGKRAAKRESGGDTVRITIHEGRYHQVKRMMEAVGHPVISLHRERFGPLSLGDLPEGSWRVLTPEELTQLSG